MKHTIIFTFSLLFALSTSLVAQINSEITYIGNEGFMIKNNDKKVFIDALYYYGNESVVMDVDLSLRKMIINNTEPFSNSQLYLVTHNHGDHYSQSMVSSYLKNNPQSTFVSTSEIIGGIKTAENEKQLVGISPAKYESVDTTVNGIKLTAYNILHDVGYRVNNLGYLINVDGLKVFHGGDNSFDDSTEYKTFKLNEKNIDVLFLWNYSKSFWKTQAQRDFIKKYINPKYIILMHIPSAQVSSIKKQVNEIGDNTFPPVIVFTTSMEKVVITDTISMSNHMPEKQTSIADTTFKINTPISIEIPFAFKDIDENDSLTYYAMGLPKGINFDSTTMNITGTGETAGKYVIKIIAKDKSLCANSLSFKLVITDPTSVISNEHQKENFIYPNPATDKLYINNAMTSQTFVQIYDLNGKLLVDKCISDNTLDITNLSKGIYTVKLINCGNIVVNRLLKE